jgi:hypothetical protein
MIIRRSINHDRRQNQSLANRRVDLSTLPKCILKVLTAWKGIIGITIRDSNIKGAENYGKKISSFYSFRFCSVMPASYTRRITRHRRSSPSQRVRSTTSKSVVEVSGYARRATIATRRNVTQAAAFAVANSWNDG